MRIALKCSMLAASSVLVAASGSAASSAQTAQGAAEGSKAMKSPATSAQAANPGRLALRRPAQGKHLVLGDVIEATNAHVAINDENGGMLILDVKPKTTVIVNGRKVPTKSISAVKGGADVLASFDEHGGQATAVRIEIDEAHTGRLQHEASAR